MLCASSLTRPSDALTPAYVCRCANIRPTWMITSSRLTQLVRSLTRAQSARMILHSACFSRRSSSGPS